MPEYTKDGKRIRPIYLGDAIETPTVRYEVKRRPVKRVLQDWWWRVTGGPARAAAIRAQRERLRDLGLD